MLHVRQWSIRLPLLSAALLARPAHASSPSEFVDGVFTVLGCMMDGLGAGQFMPFVISYCQQYMDVFAH